MSKIKLTIGLFTFLLIGLFSSRLTYASYVSITQLPGYINYTDFKLSCSALNGTTAQFSSKKDGGSYTNFGLPIDLTTSPCQVQVTGTQFGSEGKFWFKVTTDVGESETSTTLDTSGPSPVSDFGKERMNGNTMYKVHWKNPLESDFTKVFIYRGEIAGFEADDAHKVAEMGGNPGDTMSWDNGGLDPNKEYYYVIRALDHANNSSSLVGDAGVTTTSTTTGASGGAVLGSSTGGTGSGNVTQLPKEEVLGGESGVFTPAPEAATDVTNTAETVRTGLLNWVLTHKAVTLGVILALGLLWYFLRRRSK